MTAPTQEPREWDPSQYVSYSNLTLHRKCPQAWAYRHLRGLEPERSSSARDLGTWWHLVRAMDYLERGISMDSLRSAPRELQAGGGITLYRIDAGLGYRIGERGSEVTPRADVALSIAAAYWKRLGGEERDLWLEDLGESLPDRLAYLNARWLERWADDLAHEAPLGVEVKFKRSVPGTGAVMPGYIDVVYLDTRRNLTVIRDTKTSRSLDAPDAAGDLSDSQLHLYEWGVAPLVEEWGVPPVRALSYDRTRSVKPKAPSLTAAGALSKSVTDYDLHTYLEFSRGPDGDGVPWGEEGSFYVSGKRKGEPKFGTYTAEEQVVERLSSPAAQAVWFQRTLVPINRNVIKSHLQSVVHTQAEAVRTVAYFKEHGEAPRNFSRQGCKWCDFAALCRAEMLGGPGGDYPLEQFGLREQVRR